MLPQTGGRPPLPAQGGPAVRRQLVSLALRDTLRRHGIPPAWVGVETLSVQDTQFGEVVHAHLVLRHWDARFMSYATAFENSLREVIAKFEPGAPLWLHSITWKITPQSGNPRPTMPPATTWSPEPAVEPGFEETTFGDQ